MKLVRGMMAGAVGGALAFAIALASRYFLHPDGYVLPLLGGVPFYDMRTPALLTACGLDLLSGAVSAVVYAAVFEFVMHRAGWLRGSILGAAHAAIAGFIIAFAPLRQPAPDPSIVPGAFMAGWGWLAALAFVAAYVLYGATVGVGYGPVLHSTSRVPGVRWRTVRSSSSPPRHPV